LTFTIPGTDFELVNNGAEMSVTLANIDSFLKRVVYYLLEGSIHS
jgi:hypothetical protein